MVVYQQIYNLMMIYLHFSRSVFNQEFFSQSESTYSICNSGDVGSPLVTSNWPDPASSFIEHVAIMVKRFSMSNSWTGMHIGPLVYSLWNWSISQSNASVSMLGSNLVEVIACLKHLMSQVANAWNQCTTQYLLQSRYIKATMTYLLKWVSANLL